MLRGWTLLMNELTDKVDQRRGADGRREVVWRATDLVLRCGAPCVRRAVQDILVEVDGHNLVRLCAGEREGGEQREDYDGPACGHGRCDQGGRLVGERLLALSTALWTDVRDLTCRAG